MKLSVYLFLMFAVLLSLNVFAQDETDYFAGIGNRKQNNRMHLLEEKKPPVLPEKYLPLDKGRKAAFKEAEEMSTKEELYAELDKLKERFLPFMKDVAPEMKDYRDRIYLRNFKWRLETDKDRQDFISTLKGDGDWEEVSIPHFGPPKGRAVAYYFKKMDIPEEMLKDKALFICFKAVDYKAHVFVNGSYVGSHEGFFAPFEFNITKFARAGENDILVKVENDYTTTGFIAAGVKKVIGDKIYAVTGVGYDNFFDGGHQCAPGMGIYQDCYLESREPIHINDVFVRPLYDEGAAEVRIEVNNFYEDDRPVLFDLSVYGQNFEATVLKDSVIVPYAMHVPGVGDLAKPTDWQKNGVKLGYGVNFFTYKVKMPDFRSWSNDEPWLYQLQVKVMDENKVVTDTRKQSFGMRSFRIDTLSKPKGTLYFNNEKIRLRGANTMGFLQQDVFKKDWDQLIDDILLAKACNMNFLRLTQRPVEPEIYEYCDKLGLMVQNDFPTFGGIRYNKWDECVKQATEMERLVRNHPSVILDTYINERFPNAEGYPYRNMSKPEQYFSLFRAMDEAVHAQNPDRALKWGDGDYDPPTPGLPDNHCYNTWYNGHGLGVGKMYKGYWQWVKPGWYYACGEFGAEALDPVETMYKYYPKEWLPKNKEDEKNWTANKIYASQTQRFHYMWYNTQHSLKDWVEASQDHQVWALDIITEAFRRDTNMVSFAVHLFIDAWPAGWMKTIMDVDRNPKKAFFTYREALKPMIVSLRSDRNKFYSGEKANVELWVCNDLNSAPEDYQLRYQIEKNGKVIYSGSSNAAVPVNSSLFQGYVPFETPAVKQRTKYKLRAGLFDKNGNSIDQGVFDIDVFPARPHALTSKVAVEGDGQAVVDYLLKNIDIEKVNDYQSADVILIGDYDQYKNNREEFDKLAEEGKKVILFDVPAGDHKIGGTDVVIQNTAMGSYFFVSPQTDHPYTKGYEPFDFKMWYGEDKDYVTPFLDKIILGDEWTPILVSGNTNWVKDSGNAGAVSELSTGNGKIIICELDLNNRILTNPVANDFAMKLLQK